MKKIYAVITGRPGVGKTTIFTKVVEKLKEMGYSIAGFYCPEVRVRGKRVGFKIVSIDDGYEAWLARVDACMDGPRVGKYYVCLEAGSVAKKSLVDKLRSADVIAIDEIGPMELKHSSIRDAIIQALLATKPGVFVVHERLSQPQILSLLKARGVWFTVTIKNRDSIANKILETLINNLK